MVDFHGLWTYTLEDERLVHLQPSPMIWKGKGSEPNLHFRTWNPAVHLPGCTPPKTNMEPENGPLEKEIPIGNHHFQVPCLF